MTPIALIARAIQRERRRAEMSLSALASKAGLSKSTLSQLEAGNGNPSVETLWAIASALDVPFSFLFESAEPSATVVRVDEGASIGSDVSEFSTVLLADCPPNSRRDVYRIHQKKGSVRASKPHPHGTVEHVVVCQGTLRVGPDEKLEELGEGDYYRYSADVAHRYESLSEQTVYLLLMETAQ